MARKEAMQTRFKGSGSFNSTFFLASW